MKYTWKCASCGISAVHSSQSADHYRVGFEIYTQHRQGSLKCRNLELKILESTAETLILSESFQSEINRIKRLGGQAVFNEHNLTLYRGVMPMSAIDVFSVRLKHLDPNNLLAITVASEKKPAA